MIHNFEKEFITEFQKLTSKDNPYKIWSDFCEMTACSISNTIDKVHFAEREKRYLEIAGQYSASELIGISKMAALLVNILEKNPNQDFLGRMYMELEIGNKHIGQFFTPYHLSEVAAELNLSAAEPEKMPIRVCEPACGSGGMLIAFMNAAKQKEINYQLDVIFSATDLDPVAAHMCYIQTSYLGCSGTVVVGNSLTQESYSIWYTPMYFHEIWDGRRRIEAVKNILGRAGEINQTLKEKKIKTLFDFDLENISSP